MHRYAHVHVRGHVHAVGAHRLVKVLLLLELALPRGDPLLQLEHRDLARLHLAQRRRVLALRLRRLDRVLGLLPLQPLQVRRLP